jgi:FAD/FMN-containing dehydrogenase
VRARRVDWRGTRACEAAALLRPASTQEVSQVLAACHAHRQPVVTAGGLTGLVAGCIPSPCEFVLSTERLSRIEVLDATNRSMTVQAGVPLQRIQEAAADQGLLFALDLGARGSCTIGGNIATNAGGNRVIRYGMVRELVLGLEAVLADGTVLSSLNRMLKNNAGYDLKQLFIGSEGTLGVVTRAVLRLREAPRTRQTALVACRGLGDVLQLLRHCDAGLGGAITSFEVLWNDFYRLVTTPPASSAPLLPQDHGFYVIVESHGGDPSHDLQQFEAVLASLVDSGLIVDAVVAASEAQRAAIWALREGSGGRLGLERAVTFDVSLPLSDIEGYVPQVYARIARELPGWRCLTVGHLGDGNLHFVVTGGDPLADRHAIERCVYEPLQARGGSISGEHGIGTEKLGWLGISRNTAEIELMRLLKRTLDPHDILNRGRVVPPPA